ncbi:unnamed protein product [Heligmosomoides polygyrus]|uniref:ShTK domain protein n=1 Tax=Heligmosomoides polygyrus TaxID=6339 RepID=A0A183GJB8_HELPZ|nr:unnamed protein product [Heligmosomoides polygyrus]
MRPVVYLAILVLSPSTVARITDTNCTELIGVENKYSDKAVNCENRYSDANCLFIYTTAVKQGDSADRNPKCFQNPTTRQTDEQLVRMATNSCPKTCGYCCKTPEYSCQNKQNPRIACEKVTSEQCRNELWRPVLMEDCPNVCGFCTARKWFTTK